jgi:hypothetical protein
MSQSRLQARENFEGCEDRRGTLPFYCPSRLRPQAVAGRILPRDVRSQAGTSRPPPSRHPGLPGRRPRRAVARRSRACRAARRRSSGRERCELGRRRRRAAVRRRPETVPWATTRARTRAWSRAAARPPVAVRHNGEQECGPRCRKPESRARRSPVMTAARILRAVPGPARRPGPGHPVGRITAAPVWLPLTGLRNELHKRAVRTF